MGVANLRLKNVLWPAILLAWGGWTLRLVLTGEHLLYVHPRMTVYVVAASLMFLALGVVGGIRAWGSPEAGRLKGGYSLFLIPLLLTLYTGPRSLGESAAGNRILKGLAGAGRGVGQSKYYKSVDEFLSSVPPSGVLFLDDSVHAAVAYDMLANPKKYEGRLVSFIGFVHRTANLSKNQVFVTRMLLTCCVADSEPIGVLIWTEEAEKLPNTEWVKITGRMETVSFKDPYSGKQMQAPQVRVERLERGIVPKNPYLYPGQF